MQQFSMLIQWSPVDDAYIVSFPEFHFYSMTHGATYEEAARNGAEVLQMAVDDYKAHNRPLPVPNVVTYTAEELAEWGQP
jgi:predicted RNase H-like HicB family nuclease